MKATSPKKHAASRKREIANAFKPPELREPALLPEHVRDLDAAEATGDRRAQEGL